MDVILVVESEMPTSFDGSIYYHVFGRNISCAQFPEI
jgi:hypothetical protein